MDLNGTVAIITGGAGGIGFATVSELLRNGVKNVILLDINEKAGKEAIEKLTKEFGENKAVFIKTDVSKNTELEEAFKRTLEKCNDIDIIINNAAIANEVEWEKTVNVNYKAVVAGTQFAYKYLGKHNGSKGGTVVNVSSKSALRPFPAVPTYTSTKFGILGLGRAFGTPFHYERSGIRVLTVHAGLTSTNLLKNVTLPDRKMADNLQEDVDAMIPQNAENVGKHIVNIIKRADNGTHWFIERNRTFLLTFPSLEELKKEELPL